MLKKLLKICAHFKNALNLLGIEPLRGHEKANPATLTRAKALGLRGFLVLHAFGAIQIVVSSRSERSQPKLGFKDPCAPFYFAANTFQCTVQRAQDQPTF